MAGSIAEKVNCTLKYYFVMHSTVTNLRLGRLYSINNLKTTIMRTLNSNQLTERVSTTNRYVWNQKRRYRY